MNGYSFSLFVFVSPSHWGQLSEKRVSEKQILSRVHPPFWKSFIIAKEWKQEVTEVVSLCKTGSVPIHLKLSKGGQYGRNQSDSVIYRQVIVD